MTLTAGIILGVTVSIWTLAICVRRLYRRAPDEVKTVLNHYMQIFSPQVKVKILLGFYLITVKVIACAFPSPPHAMFMFMSPTLLRSVLSQIDSVYEINMPYQVKQILHVISIVVSFGLKDVSTPLECIG